MSEPLAFLIGIFTVWSFYWIAHKDPRGFKLGFLTQLLWSIFIIDTRLWGFIPMVVFFMFMYGTALFAKGSDHA